MLKKILLIEDDKSIVEIISQFISEEGYAIKSYTDGNKIKYKLRKFKPDLLLIDFLLPGKNGDEVIKTVRNCESSRHLPIVMIAANLIYKKRAIVAGANEFLEKPFDMYELLNVIRRYTQTVNRFVV